jgi:uncharacterized protein YjdB
MALFLAACGGEDGGAPKQSNSSGAGDSIKSLELTPAQGSIPVGLGQQFVALATMSDGSVRDITNDATLYWGSSNGAVATVGDTGLAIGIGPGATTITVSGTAMGDHFSAKAELTVTSPVVTALQMTPATASVPVGFEQAFIATAILSDGSSLDVTNNAALSWTSSDPAIASIGSGSNKGLVIAKSPGTVTITANGINFKASAKLMVTSAVVTGLQITPVTAAIPVGFEQAFIATANLSDGTSLDITNSIALSWSSSDPAIASINSGGESHRGLATAKAMGIVTVTASGIVNGNNFSATATLTVTNAVVTALQIAPAIASVPVGFEQVFVATAFLSDGSSLDITNNAALNWTSSDPTVATIDNRSGLATGVTTGNVTITASGTANGTRFSATGELAVTSAVVAWLQVTPVMASVPVGFEQAFIATAILSDGSSLDVTNNAALSWSSSDPAIATIDSNNGVVNGVATGNVTITASGSTQGIHFSATAELTVTGAIVVALQVTPAMASIPVGLEQPFVATALMSDGTLVDITTSAELSWNSSDPAIATIGIQSGVATGNSEGAAIVTISGIAAGAHLSASAQLTVTSAVLTGLQLTPAGESIPVGFDQAFVATATFSDGSSLDVTSNALVSWSSSDPAIATIASGIAIGRGEGVATITASGSVNGANFSATAELTVRVPSGCDVGSLTNLGLIFICPPTQREADDNGIVYELAWLERGVMFVLMNWEQADTYCNNLGNGYRLPTRQELKDLYFRYGPLHNYAGWPFNFTYWTSTGISGAHFDVNITNGLSDEKADTFTVYVSCVRSNN